MSSLPIPRYTPQQYLEMERKAEFKSEYANGFIWPRGIPAPVTVSAEEAQRRHEQILDNFIVALRQRLSSTATSVIYRASLACVTPKGATTDIAVRWDATIVPRVIIEVLSPITEGDDRGRKFTRYRGLDGLAEYVMVSQERPRVEHYTRQDENRWALRECRTCKDTLRLPSLDCKLPLSEIYAQVEFPTWSLLPEADEDIV